MPLKNFGTGNEFPLPGDGLEEIGDGNVTVRTTAANGNWNAGATWVGGVAPDADDTVVLGHTVTVTANATIGAGTVSTDAITINSGGVLILNEDVQLTVNGDITPHAFNRLQIDMLLGSDIIFGNTGYQFKCPSQYPGSIPFLRIRGTEAKPCTISTVTGGTNAELIPTSNYTCLIDAEWCNFTRIGGASTAYAINGSLNSDGSIANSSLARFVNCTFDNCGEVRYGAMGAHARVTFQNCKFINCLGDLSLRLEGVFAKNVDATRLIDNVRADTRAGFFNPKGFTVQNSVLTGFVTSTPADGDEGMTIEDSVIILPDNGDPLIAGPVFRNCFAYYSDASKVNKHFFEVGNYVLIPEYTIEDCVFEANGSDSDGDTFILGTPAVGGNVDVILRNCITLPNSGGDSSGTMISQLGNARTFVTVENCTMFVGTGGALAAGETYAGHTNLWKSVRGNIFWDTSERGYAMYDSGVDDSVSNLITSANLNYNCKFRVLTGSNGVGYNNLEFSSGTPGANDIEEDPEFTDSARDFLSYDVAQGGDGNVNNAINRWIAGDYTPTALLTYIREGFTPRNQALKNASFDGGDIGAVAVGEPLASGLSHQTIFGTDAPIY